MGKIVIKVLMVIAAAVLFIAGLIGLLTPIPGGIFMLAGSLTILVYYSARAARNLQWARSRFTWINRSLYWLEEKTSTRFKIISDTLKKTRPFEGTEGKRISYRTYVKLAAEKKQAKKAQAAANKLKTT